MVSFDNFDACMDRAKDSQFPSVSLDDFEATPYALLCYITKPVRAQDNTIFFVLYHMYLHMLVNQHPHLSLSLYKQYMFVTNFKAEFHIIYIHARRDTKNTWNPLPYLVTENDLLA